jgi:putative ABC transport system substrate-binding protein
VLGEECPASSPLIVAVGGLVLSSRAVAQQQSVPRIGVLWHAGTAEEEEKIPLGALVEGLREVGYIDGQTMALDNRFPNEEPERFKILAAGGVAIGYPHHFTRQAAIATKQATTTIPIFFLCVIVAQG